MKKFFVSLLMVSAMLAQSTVGFTVPITPSTSQSAGPTLTYSVDQSYTVTIPDNITINGTTGASGSASNAQTVKLAGGALINGGQTLKVTLSSITPTLYIDKDKYPTLSVPVATYKDESTSAMSSTTVITGTAGNTSSDITASLVWKTTAAAKVAGTYTGTVTFEVTVS